MFLGPELAWGRVGLFVLEIKHVTLKETSYTHCAVITSSRIHLWQLDDWLQRGVTHTFKGR